MKKQLLGWQVFWVSTLYYVGKPKHQCMMHETRAKARDQIRKMKEQPWTFSKIFMCRVVVTEFGNRYERVR